MKRISELMLNLDNLDNLYKYLQKYKNFRAFFTYFYLKSLKIFFYVYNIIIVYKQYISLCNKNYQPNKYFIQTLLLLHQ